MLHFKAYLNLAANLEQLAMKSKEYYKLMSLFKGVQRVMSLRISVLNWIVIKFDGLLMAALINIRRVL